MSTVFVSVSVSLDGYMAPEQRPDDVGDRRFFAQWMQLQRWIALQRTFRRTLHLGDDGRTGEDDDHVARTFARTGVTIMGKRMFDSGERMWPEEPPFHSPVFVLTRTVREPWVRKGGTTFWFVNDGLHAALARAREVANGRDIRIGGGAHTVRAYLKAGLVDELELAISPVLLGGGLPLFDRMEPAALELVRTWGTDLASHVHYHVRQG